MRSDVDVSIILRLAQYALSLKDYATRTDSLWCSMLSHGSEVPVQYWYKDGPIVPVLVMKTQTAMAQSQLASF